MVCGGDKPVATLSDDAAAALTPRLLRLAHRPGQTAMAYIQRLRELLARDSVAASAIMAPSASVRDCPTLDRLHGLDEAVAWGMSLATDIERYRAGKIQWSAVDRGLLLSGPPGCGKTLFARALAATSRVPLVTGSYAVWLASGASHQGDLLKAMRKTFSDARKSAPCILFIDEIDSFPNRATITHHYVEWETQVVNALLAEIDGTESRDGVVLVGACNHPQKLDPALVRSGRLDRHIRVELPNRAALAAMLREHLGDDLAGEDLLDAALRAAGSSGADTERFVRGARRRARNAGRSLALGDLLIEIGGADERTAREWEVTAVHEAGHALAVHELEPGALRAVTLTGNETRNGGTEVDYRAIHVSAADVRRRLVVLLAGRAAEQVVLKTLTSSAGGDYESDLARATVLTATALASLGLDEKTGLTWFGISGAADLRRLLEEQPALAARIREILDDAYVEALAMMGRRSAAVRKLAAALLERRALDGADAAIIIASCPAHASVECVPF
jgi:ATP-dependent Zn protease